MTPSAIPAWLNALRPLGETMYFLWRIAMSVYKVAATIFAMYGLAIFASLQHPETLTVEALLQATPVLLRFASAAALILFTVAIIFGCSPFGQVLPRRWVDCGEAACDRWSSRLIAAFGRHKAARWRR